MNSLLDDLFATDKTIEEDGLWVDISPTPNGPKEKLRFKVRAYSAKAVGDLREKLAKPYQTMVRAGAKIPDEQNEEIGLRVIAGAVLASWDGLPSTEKTDDGKFTEVPYHPETAYDYLKRLPKMANVIIQISTDGALFKADAAREDGAGN